MIICRQNGMPPQCMEKIGICYRGASKLGMNMNQVVGLIFRVYHCAPMILLSKKQ